MPRSRPDTSVLRDAPPFARYDDRTLAPLARHADRLDLRPGTPLARRGERAREAVVVVAGEAVAVGCGGVERLGPGAWIGAREALAGTAHDVTVVAGDDLRVVVLPAPALRWADQTLPGLLPRPEPLPGAATGATASRAA
jgi:CRP-like cAMP-binding protein